MDKISRRHFLKAASAAAATPAISAAARTRTAEAPPAPHSQAYTFLNPQESSFLVAATERLIPKDELGPGATDAGVTYFIDRQLGGAWGAGERLYRSGPFREGTPSQGYQLPFTPAELFRRAIRAINTEIASRNAAFARMSAQDQDAYLTSLSKEKRDLDGVPSNVFFESLLEVTIEGYFSDPAYGGNRDMAAWEMIGFPGAYAEYYDLVGINQPYRRKPLSLAENGRGRVHLMSMPMSTLPKKAR
ncbi:MAG TPA: gluconate 2-dehydrogenase subunit 3 family protein [Usitatibacter sp.]|nr:gluconate 2-dehydrogenase subunit 3 family protein [Usitatibacter sp.]